jgi:hypothetical protein
MLRQVDVLGVLASSLHSSGVDVLVLYLQRVQMEPLEMFLFNVIYQVFVVIVSFHAATVFTSLKNSLWIGFSGIERALEHLAKI